jgi:hypothetical protein
MNNKKTHISFKFLVLDLFLLNASFMAMNYFKRGTFVLQPFYYVKLLIIFNIIWLISSLVMKKFDSDTYKGYRDVIMLFAKTTTITCYIVSIMVVIMGLFAFSRLHIFGTFCLLLIGETAIFTVYYFGTGRQAHVRVEKTEVDVYVKQRISARLLIADFIFFNAGFFALHYYKRGTLVLDQDYQKLLLIFYGLWAISSLITRKFDKDTARNYWNALTSCIKSFLLMTSVLAVLVFALRLHYYSRLQIFGTLGILFFFEIFLYLLYFAIKKEKASKKDIESIEEINKYLEQKGLGPDSESLSAGFIPDDPVRSKLETALEFFDPWLFKFIDNGIDLSKISKNSTKIVSSEEVFNVKNIDDHSLSLFINLHQLNDIRRLNEYFLELHSKLKNGSYFVGKAKTLPAYRRYVLKNYSKFTAELMYAMHLIFFRIIPKLPLTKEILSKSEILGRLCFCGFEIISEKEVDYNVYFLVRKVKTPSLEKSPTYGPLVKLNRIGLNGQLIKVYKFRTMHPYSEFLQEYVYEKNKLKEGGKLENDFRVTGWGQFMRKTWLDELPMLYNWIRGEVKLFGIRPISSHYLSLYSEKLKKMRKKVKPGLIPPFYADLPKTFSEICDSEERYLRACQKNPIRTQWIYFWRAFSNIVFKGVRSN